MNHINLCITYFPEIEIISNGHPVIKRDINFLTISDESCHLFAHYTYVSLLSCKFSSSLCPEISLGPYVLLITYHKLGIATLQHNARPVRVDPCIAAPLSVPKGRSGARTCRHIRTGAQWWLMRSTCLSFLNSRWSVMLARGEWIRSFQGTVKASSWDFGCHRVQRIPRIPRVGTQTESLDAHTFSQSSRSAGQRLRLFAAPSVWVTTRLTYFARIFLLARWMRCVRETLTMSRSSRTSSSSQTIQECRCYSRDRQEWVRSFHAKSPISHNEFLFPDPFCCA